MKILKIQMTSPAGRARLYLNILTVNSTASSRRVSCYHFLFSCWQFRQHFSVRFLSVLLISFGCCSMNFNSACVVWLLVTPSMNQGKGWSGIFWSAKSSNVALLTSYKKKNKNQTTQSQSQRARNVHPWRGDGSLAQHWTGICFTLTRQMQTGRTGHGGLSIAGVVIPQEMPAAAVILNICCSVCSC
jgi:hypothetical protein